MARIIEGERRLVKLSVDDVLSVVREYQNVAYGACCYEHLRELLERRNFYLPED